MNAENKDAVAYSESNGFLKEWNFKEQISNGFMSVPDGIDDELPFS